MAEALIRDRMARLGIAGDVASAGLVSEGVVASEGSVRAMAKRGLDLSAHRSTLLAEDAIATADLVLGMTREHVREAVVLVPDAFERAFTLRELVRRAEATGPRRVDPDGGEEELDAWLRRVGAGRQAVDLMGESEADAVADPIGRSRRVYERTAAEIEDLVDRFLALAHPAPAAACST